MVARINIGSSIKGALSYNEQKIRHHKADLILASGFACDVDSLGFTQKLERFTKLIQDNEKSKKTNTLHISLNFPKEENITTEKMQAIARDYMEKIGFDQQPYLVYQHYDANHPHIHILTTPVKEKGIPISLHYIGRDRSEPARKALEIEYGLIQAETRSQKNVRPPTALSLLRADYGKEETKHTITNIVGDVIQNYKFSSLEEYNAILRDMNVMADRGLPGSLTFEKGGLVYSVLNENGEKIGRPIKASDIYGSPTLKILEGKFSKNAVKKVSTKKYVQKGVQDSLTYSSRPEHFLQNLAKRSQVLQFLRNDSGEVDQIMVVDHRNKSAFTLSELGIELSDILAKLKVPHVKRQTPTLPRRRRFWSPLARTWKLGRYRYRIPQPYQIIIRILFSPSKPGLGGPGYVPKRKKKKRRYDY